MIKTELKCNDHHVSAEVVEYTDCTSNCYLLVPIRNGCGWDPGGWEVCDLATKVIPLQAELYFGGYWARSAIGEVQSYQSVCHVKP